MQGRMGDQAVASLVRAALAIPGCRKLQPFAGSQHLVCHLDWQDRRAIGKLRHSNFARRLEKEARSLELAHSLRIRAPRLLACCRSGPCFLLVETLLPQQGRRLHPLDLLAQLAPLHQCMPAQGWGPLRADGRPRWSDPKQALSWYESLLPTQQAQRQRLQELLRQTWPARLPGLIHGDCHRDNLCGYGILDWESVALADPWEDAARLALANSWPAPWRWLRTEESDPRWQGAWLRSCLEAARYPGLRQSAARLFLSELLRN